MAAKYNNTEYFENILGLRQTSAYQFRWTIC